MALAFRVLRWTPDAFWRATPRELVAAVYGPADRHAPRPATSGDLARLMQAFPDALAAASPSPA